MVARLPGLHLSMSKMEDSDTVILPSDLPRWQAVKELLLELKCRLLAKAIDVQVNVFPHLFDTYQYSW